MFNAIASWAKDDRLLHPAKLVRILQVDKPKKEAVDPGEEPLRRLKLETIEIPTAAAVAELVTQRDPLRLNTLMKDQGPVNAGWLRQHVELWRDAEQGEGRAVEMSFAASSSLQVTGDLLVRRAKEDALGKETPDAESMRFMWGNTGEALRKIAGGAGSPRQPRRCLDVRSAARVGGLDDWDSALDRERERLLPGGVRDDDFKKLLAARDWRNFSRFPTWLERVESFLTLEQTLELVRASAILADTKDTSHE